MLCGLILHFLRINFTCQVELSLWAALDISSTTLGHTAQPIMNKHHEAQHSLHTLKFSEDFIFIYSKEHSVSI